MTAIPRLLFAAPASGGGKTTVTCAFLHAALRRRLTPASFKCGPDYIDPLFHAEVVGVPGHNLDLFFTPEETVRGLLAHGARGADLAVLEGVMGYYDGVADTDRSSTWAIAWATGTPVILVVDPKGTALTLAAGIRGLMGFREPCHIAGILLNRCTEGLYEFLRPVLERETGLPVVGHLPPLPDAAFESRHLGLVPAGEVAGLRRKVEALGEALEAHADLDRMLAIAAGAPLLDDAPPPPDPVTRAKPVIAVAKDAAFCFYYRENLELLEALGAGLRPFSPLADRAVPPEADALYLGGGYPELHGEALAANRPMLESVRRAAAVGMPLLAECGGFQYLQETLLDLVGGRHRLAGVLPGGSEPARGRRRFGYITLTARRDTLLCRKGETLPAHEFHHWDSDRTGDAFAAEKPVTGRSWSCVEAAGNLFAGYPHLYFPGAVEAAGNFVRAADAYRSRKEAADWRETS